VSDIYFAFFQANRLNQVELIRIAALLFAWSSSKVSASKSTKSVR
jgi:hypothetical protein